MTLSPTRSYLVCANARSGSNLLCRALSDTGIAGHPDEYFSSRVNDGPGPRPLWEQSELARAHGVTTRAAYLDLVHQVGSTPNGIFGAKAMWHYLPRACDYLREIPAYAHLETVAQVVAAVFPGLRAVHLVRRDRLRQAISWLRAAQDWVWIVSDTEPARPRGTAEYNPDAIAQLMGLIAAGEQGWRDLYAQLDITPLELDYEDFLTSAGYEDAVRRVLRHLDLPSDGAIPRPRALRQSDDVNEEWRRRFLAERG